MFKLISTSILMQQLAYFFHNIYLKYFCSAFLEKKIIA